MSGYMSRLFARSNSSVLLQSGNALEAKVVRLKDQMYLVDAGIGRPRIATQEELIKPPNADGAAPFRTRVGYLKPSNKDSPVKNLLLQRCFADLVTGDPRTKQQAAVRFENMVGDEDAAAGDEQPLLLPRRFRKTRALMELQNAFKAHRKVKGFVAEKVRGGYTIGIAGYLAFLPARQSFIGRVTHDRFMIESIKGKKIILSRGG